MFAQLISRWLAPSAGPRMPVRARGRRMRSLLIDNLESREVLSSVTWAAGPDLPAGRTDISAFLGSNHDVNVVGGNSSSVLRLASSGVNWTNGQPIDAALKSPAVALTSHGSVYIYGGIKGNSASEEGWLYDYYGGDSQNIGNLNTPRGNLGSAVDSLDRIYAIGGLDDNNRVINSVERYNAHSDEWEFVSPLPAPRQNVASTATRSGQIYVFGGQNSTGLTGITATSYRYDPGTNAWITVAPMPIATTDSTAVFAPDDHIYVLGGRTSGGATAVVQIYDPVADLWELGESLPAPLYNHGAAIDSLGRIVVVGGTNTAGGAIANVTRSQRLDIPEVAPAITSLPATAGSLDTFYTYDINASGNPEPTYSLISAPHGMVINSATGLITWQPIDGQTGAQSVTVQATNRVGSTTQDFVINVLADTLAPTAPTELSVVSVNTQSVTLSWTAATDARGVDHYDILEGFRSGWRGRSTSYRVIQSGITATTATITGLAPLSTHKYTVQAVDAAGNKSRNSNVVVASTQSAPTLKYYANGAINGPVDGKANFPIQLQLVATANPAPTFVIVAGPDSIALHPNSGLLTWLPTAADVGLHNVTVRASNAIGSSELVIPLNIAPDLPVLSTRIVPNSDGTVGAVAGIPFQLQAIDSSHTISTFELVAGPLGMSIDAQTGLATWTPTAADAGTTQVTIRATNSAGNTEITSSFETYFTSAPSNIRVTHLTALHPLASWDAPIGEGADEIAGYAVLAIARYRSGRFSKTHSVRIDVPGANTSTELIGLLSGKTYSIYVNAYNADAKRGVAGRAVDGFVPAPALPVISWSVTNASDGPIVVGQAVNIQMTNHNADPVQYSLVNGPTGVTLDSPTGLATWVPTNDNIGVNTLTVRATNSVGSRDISVTIHVLFSGPVLHATAVTTGGTTLVTWSAPVDNAEPIVSYQVTMQWRWSGRTRTRTVTVPASQMEVNLSLIPTGAVWHQGVYITPVDALGRLGASSSLVPYTN